MMNSAEFKLRKSVLMEKKGHQDIKQEHLKEKDKQ